MSYIRTNLGYFLPKDLLKDRVPNSHPALFPFFSSFGQLSRVIVSILLQHLADFSIFPTQTSTFQPTISLLLPILHLFVMSSYGTAAETIRKVPLLDLQKWGVKLRTGWPSSQSGVQCQEYPPQSLYKEEHLIANSIADLTQFTKCFRFCGLVKTSSSTILCVH